MKTKVNCKPEIVDNLHTHKETHQALGALDELKTQEYLSQSVQQYPEWSATAIHSSVSTSSSFHSHPFTYRLPRGFYVDYPQYGDHNYIP